MTTFVPQIIANNERKWYLIDAKNVVLGKLAVQAANILRGKNKNDFTPHLDRGDYLIITNANKIKLTGNKEKNKLYYNHTGYIGHLKTKTAEKLKQENPTKIIELAIKGMIPLNKLQKDILKRLKVFA